MYSPVRTRLISRMASKMKPITNTRPPRLISGCRVTKDSGAVSGLQLAQNPDRREIRAEIECHITEYDERLDRRRHHDQVPGFRPVQQHRVVHRVGRPVHDRVLPHDQRRAQHHQQHRAARVLPPPTDEHDSEHRDHDRGTDLRHQLPVIPTVEELDRAGGVPRRSGSRPEGRPACDRPRRTTRGNPARRPERSPGPPSSGLIAPTRWVPVPGGRTPVLSSDQPSSPKRSTRCELMPSASSVRATR